MRLKLLLKTFIVSSLCIFQSTFAQLNLTNRVPEWTTLGLSNEVVFSNFTSVQFNDIQEQFSLTNCETFDYILLNFQNIEIILPPGDLHLTCLLDLPSNVVLVGDSIQSTNLIFDNLVESDLIHVAGSSSNEFNCQNSLAKGQNFFVNATIANQLSINELIYIYSPDDSLITSSWAASSTGQFVTIINIVNDSVYFENPLRRDYLSNCKIQQLQIIENVGFKNLNIINNCPTTSQTNNILFQFARNCFVQCVSSLNSNFAHINISNSSGILVEKSNFKDGFSYGDGGKAYGVVLQFGSGDCLITSNYFNHLRHSMLFQSGSNGNVVSYNYSVNPYWTDVSLPSNSAGDIVLHGNYPYMNLIEGNSCQNIVIDDSHGMNGPYNTLLRNRTNLYGIVMNNNPSTDSVNFIGNEIGNSAFLMGNFVSSGNGHIFSGNNKLGQCNPPNTLTGNPTSLYLNQPINFYSTVSSWPPIGYPNSLNQYKIKAEFAVLNGHSLCDCCDEEFASLNEITEDGIQLFYSNDFKTIKLLSTENIIDYSIIDLSGKIIITQKNVNNTELQLTEIPSNKGYYILHVVTEKTNQQIKILLN